MKPDSEAPENSETLLMHINTWMGKNYDDIKM